MLGPEIVIALSALVLAFVVWGKSEAQARRAQRAIASVQSDAQARGDELAKRLSQLESARPAFEGSIDEQTFRKLAATVKVLELRALEHDALLCSSVTEDEARHLWNIAKDEPTIYDRHPGVEAELRSLVRRGLIKKRSEFKIHQLPPRFALLEHFELAESGEMLLALRKHLKASDTRRADSLPPKERESGVVTTVVPQDAPSPSMQSIT